MNITRRSAHRLLLGSAAAAATGLRVLPAKAAEQVIRIGITEPVTGADAEDATLQVDGALLAIKQANDAQEVKGYRLEPVVLNNATATAGQYDPAQAATNARKMVADPSVMAAVGPDMSGSGKAMSPILSMGNLATITPASTNPDITDPKYAAEYRPAGKAIYFRTVTTDAYQGPEMANFYQQILKAKSVYLLDDSGAYGVGLVDAFEGQAKKIGLVVTGRDRLDPKAADYTTGLTKIKALNPDSLYYGGVMEAGVKLAKQSYDIVPHLIKGGGDGVYDPEMLTAVGFPAAQGWYATIASPHVLDEPRVAKWVSLYKSTYGKIPGDYAVTAYDAALVIISVLRQLAAAGEPITREAVRSGIQNAHVETLQGTVSFDANGDVTNRVISVFQVVKNPNYPLTDIMHQFKYIGVAPQLAT